MTQAHDVNGELIKLRREERGWAQTDLAVRACMSVKQIRQIEEGGVSAFYSESVKVSAAKKVAGILGMSPDDLWAKADVAHDEPAVEHEVVADVQAAHEVVESAAHESEQHEEPEHAATPVQEPVVDHKPVVNASTHHSQEVEVAKPKTSLWLIAGLFGAALAIAAFMRPDAEPVATEPPPPLQAVPSEASDAASTASAAVDVASASEVSASAAKTVASSPVAAASLSAVMAPKPAASVASASAVAKPVVAASAPARPASVQVQPSASAASK